MGPGEETGRDMKVWSSESEGSKNELQALRVL